MFQKWHGDPSNRLTCSTVPSSFVSNGIQIDPVQYKRRSNRTVAMQVYVVLPYAYRPTVPTLCDKPYELCK